MLQTGLVKNVHWWNGRQAVGLFSTGAAITFMAAMAVGAPPADRADRAVIRVAPERMIGGLTPEARLERQRQLHGELIAALPAGAFGSPIRVELSEQDRMNLAAPFTPDGRAPLRIGVVKSIAPAVAVVRGELFKPGVLQATADGGLVWAVTVTSPGAQAIRLQLKNFSLPPNGEMYFFSRDGQVDGPYVGLGRNGNGEFWTRSVASDTGVLLFRLNGPVTKADRQRVSFAISAVGHINGRRPPAPDPQSHDSWPCSDNAPCVVDANCVNGTPADVAKDAVAKMEWIQGPFINTCTGGLLADTDPSTQIPLFLTANHCLSKNNSNLETFFFYTTSSCNGTCPDSLVTGGTPPPADTVGVTILATGKAGDFSLFQLNEAPPSGVAFLGWNNSPVAFTDGAQLYRISNPNFGPQAFSHHQVDADAPTCTQWPRGERIYSTDLEGATMGGSSGSPVVNAASEVVGQLSGCCGFNCGDVCDTASNSTVDGALAFYYDQVAGFLNPSGGGGCTGDGDCQAGEICCSGSCVVPACSSDADCNDGDACTTDTCSNGGTCSASCSNTGPSCGPADGCCPSGCSGGSDPDCPTCGGNQAPCSSNADCCSGSCRNGTCRGN